MDSNGYPDEQELEKIKAWPYQDIAGLFAFVRSLWKYADFGYWSQDGRVFKISTGGWSGNEDLIHAMEYNRNLIWAITCNSWRRGGHYEFEIPELTDSTARKEA